ncbi:MAG: cytochrome c nitrite reductase small subunit [Elusimicrobia bacterium]|nr:cytochrome c nitrite reductase small subunit [Elusimicrobiota bacterium]
MTRLAFLRGVPLRMAQAAAAAAGLAAGLGLYTFVYAKGYSYLSSDPEACVNCHVMRPQFDGWVKSSHHAVASCNDCHLPQGVAGKLFTKASNGFWHSYYFTTGGFPDNIQITPRNLGVAETACRSCHSDVVHALDPARKPEAAGLACLRCHGAVGHQRD